jgi:DNA-binding HxlR family transcriptional regulator
MAIVLHLRRETKRFSELQRGIGHISQKALTASLRALEQFAITNWESVIEARRAFDARSAGPQVIQISVAR